MGDLHITWPQLDANIKVELNDDKAPDVCEAIRDHTPVESTQVHALVSGALLFSTLPIYAYPLSPHTEYVSEMDPGAVGFAVGSQRLWVKYGEIAEPEAFPVIGRVVDDDLDTVQSVGTRTWEHITSPHTDREPITVKYTAE